MVKQVERRDKSEKPPALYDLTTLQRDANRLLGYTAQQTLDYLQNLYEKKLCTYPRTDSRYLTSDMAEGLPVLVQITAGAMSFAAGVETACDAVQVINDKKVTDHHAVIPTRNLQDADLSGLPVGERMVLNWWPCACCARWRNRILTRKPLSPWSAPVRSLPPRAAR